MSAFFMITFFTARLGVFFFFCDKHFARNFHAATCFVKPCHEISFTSTVWCRQSAHNSGHCWRNLSFSNVSIRTILRDSTFLRETRNYWNYHFTTLHPNMNWDKGPKSICSQVLPLSPFNVERKHCQKCDKSVLPLEHFSSPLRMIS